MPKKIFYLLILNIVAALLLTACGAAEAPVESKPAADTSPTEAVSEPVAEATEDVTEAEAETTSEPAAVTEEAESESMAAEGNLEITDLTVGVLPIVDVAPLYLAIDKGYFAEEGLTVTPQIGQGGAAIVAATVSGDFDIGFSAYTSFFQAQEAGIELRILAEANRAVPGFAGIYVTSDSAITSPADLVGATVSVPTVNSISPLTLNAVLDDMGIDYSGVNYLEIPFPEIIPNLEQGNVDAIFTVEPFTTFAASAGHVSVLDPFSGPTDGLPVAGYAVTREFAAANPNTVAAFQRALLKAAADAQANPEEVQDIVLTYTAIPPEVVPNLNLPEFPTDIDRAELQRFADLMIEFGFLEQAPNLDELILRAP